MAAIRDDLAQSEKIVEAMRANGLPVGYIEFEGEGHGFRRYVRQMPDTPASQPGFFVGWWEADFYTRDGEPRDVTGIIEHIDSAGNFTVFRDGERIGGGHHVDFIVDSDGFTNVPVAADPDLRIARELAIYRFSGDLFEVCKASEHVGRPTSFASPRGSGWTHAAIRRISDNDPRIPAKG